MIRAWLTISMVAAFPAAAADMLQLQQTVLPDENATVALFVDRDRVATARLRQGAKPPFVVEVTLIGEPNISLAVNCKELAGARQVFDALRTRSPAMLDVSGRCWFD
jgi:hypothetical protein